MTQRETIMLNFLEYLLDYSRRVAGDDVERTQVDKNRCLDCGAEWEEE